jgi:hypothetical protein
MTYSPDNGTSAMPVTVEWHNLEKTALRLTYAGILHSDDVRDAHVATNKLLETVSYPVVIVSDYRATTSTVIGTLGRIRPTMETPLHPNTARLTIYVGANSLITTLGKIVVRLYPARFAGRDVRIVRTLDEADRIIQEHVANIPS